MASAIYLLNDMGDLAADRAHPRKRNRPFASGALPVLTGLTMVPFLAAVAILLGIWSGALIALLIYAGLSLAYTLRLKEMPLIDVFVLAGLYTIRMYAGNEAGGYALSTWLLGFSAFLFLSLALVKRVSELSRLRSSSHTKADRRGYLVEDLPTLQMFGISTTFASSVVLSLYVQSETASNLYRRPEMLIGLVPLFVFWQCRLWLSTARGYMHDDPIVYAARDWVSWCVFLATAAVVVAAKLPV
jgi:4-hydroxybenzoate polyprenyltransferase